MSTPIRTDDTTWDIDEQDEDWDSDTPERAHARPESLQM